MTARIPIVFSFENEATWLSMVFSMQNRLTKCVCSRNLKAMHSPNNVNRILRTEHQVANLNCSRLFIIIALSFWALNIPKRLVYHFIGDLVDYLKLPLVFGVLLGYHCFSSFYAPLNRMKKNVFLKCLYTAQCIRHAFLSETPANTQSKSVRYT